MSSRHPPYHHSNNVSASIPGSSNHSKQQRHAPYRKIKRNFDTVRAALEVAKLVPPSHYTLLKEESQYYERIMKIGQGTFGEVFKCRCKTTGKLVAIKRILMDSEKEGFPITALREIRMLKLMRHVNVTELVDICVSTNKDGKDKDKAHFFLVFVFCDHDLSGILSKKDLNIEGVVAKTMLKHMFEGLNYIHGCNVLHRDMKTANILLSRDGHLKLADFGLARPSTYTKCYTNRVVTMWYRPPELLLGERDYDSKIDMWGAGCIMTEFWIRHPIFQGNTEQDQLDKIARMCGPITNETMPRCEQLPYYRNLGSMLTKYKRVVQEKLEPYVKNRVAIDLIDKLLLIDPEKRPSAAEALKHNYFHTEPKPMNDVSNFVSTLKTSCFEYTIAQNMRKARPPPGVLPQPRPQNPNQYVDRIY